VGDHVFVCYARKDSPFVLQLASKLRSLGIPVWLDTWHLAPGSDWDRDIDHALNHCAQMLVVLSKASVASSEVRAELRTALDLGKPVIPILREPCDIPRQLKTIQFIDATAAGDEDEVARRARDILTIPANLTAPGSSDVAAVADVEGRADHEPARVLPVRHSTAGDAYFERTTSDLLLRLGEAESRFDWDAVIRLGEQLLQLTGGHAPAAVRTAAAYRLRAMTRASQGGAADAYRDYTRALALERTSAETWYRRGVLRRRLTSPPSPQMPRAVDDFRMASRLWRDGQRLHDAAVVDLERERGEDYFATVALLFAAPGIGAYFLSMVLTTSMLTFAQRLTALVATGIAAGLIAAIAGWYAHSVWGRKPEKKVALVILPVLAGGVTGAATGCLLPPPSHDELDSALVAVGLALPAVAAPFIAVLATAWRRGGT
jgi:hypothetical protein